MASSFSACLTIALRLVRESMAHDSEDRKKEAFCQYLSSIIYICGVLKDEVWQKDLRNCHCQETMRLFKLSSQCLERAQDLLKTSGETIVITSPTTENQPVTPLRKCSQDSMDQTNNLRPAKQLHLPSPPISPSLHRRVQFVDEARRGNTQLLTAYRARMERRDKQMAQKNCVTRRADVTTMNLSLFRKMAENIEIAKARQKSLEKKQIERQQMLREEADRRMGPSSLLTANEQLKKEMYVKVLVFEQETIWLVSLRDQLKARPEDASLIQQIINRVLSTNEHPLTKCLMTYQFEIRKSLMTVLEQARDILIHIANMERIRSSDNSEKVLDNNTCEKQNEPNGAESNEAESNETKEISLDEELCELLDSSEKSGHVLDSDKDCKAEPELSDENSEPEQSETREKKSETDTEFLSEEREKEYKSILETDVKRVQFSLEMLHSLFLLVYEQFSSPAGQDLCLASVECEFFRPLWPQLLSLYRIVNYKREAALVKVIVKYATCTPRSLNVPDRLCLHNETTDGTTPVPPYQCVVDELQSLASLACPLEKLECIVRINRFIVDCVEDYYEARGRPRNSPEVAIGCDDLLPILCYVIIRSQLPQLVSECHAMEDFISSDYLMGEEGYSLTTFQTALAYLETL